jgi:hypothetical protein
MPDLAAIILAFFAGIFSLASIIARTSGDDSRFSRRACILAPLLTLLLGGWVVYAFNLPTQIDKVELFDVETVTYKDGTKKQFVDFSPTNKRDLSQQSNVQWFPEGTKLKRTNYHPWTAGIYWAVSGTKEEYVLPEPATQPNGGK